MSNFEPAELDRSATDLADRTVRALTDYMLVVEDAPGVFLVYGAGGDEYTVDAEAGACTCPDAEYRAPDGGCKHYRRVAFHTGERAVPEWVDRDAVDPLLDEQLDEVGKLVQQDQLSTDEIATDGGEIVVAGDGGEIIDENEDGGGAYSRHREPPEQGGKKYVRCTECGRENLVELGGRENILHREGCPQGGRDV